MPQTSRVKTLSYLLAALLAALIIGGLAWRLTIGFDFSDEAYYANFLDDWLKEGIAKSPLLTVHQTAALLLYPAAVLYRHLNGSLEGLFLFLRQLFLIGNIIAAAAFFCFLRRITGDLCAYLAALAALCFIPASLPAPSYNTIGIQALSVALCMLGSGMLSDSIRHQRICLAVSAAAWAITVTAYPTLLVAVVALLILLPLRLPQKRAVVLYFYFPLLMACLAIAAIMLVSVLSWEKLHESFLFLGAFNGSFSVAFKLYTYVHIMRSHNGFCEVCLIAICLGFARSYMPPRIIALASACVVTAIVLYPASQSVLIFRSDDIIAFAGFSGVSLLGRARLGASDGEKILRILYSISVCAGMATVASSTNGVMNFCIGGFPAAIIAMSATALEPSARKATAASLAVFLSLLLVMGLGYEYSDKYGLPEKREYISWGEAKGLYVAQDVGDIMEQMRKEVNPLLKPGDSILVLGRLPGLGMMTPAVPRALCIYPMYHPFTTAKALAMVHGYYHIPTNRPDIVVMYKDRHMVFINPFGEDFDTWYAHVAGYPAPPGILDIYRKRP
jgi:hypothetical protein